MGRIKQHFVQRSERLNGQKPYQVKLYKALNVCCQETPINNKVVRVRLLRNNFEDSKNVTTEPIITKVAPQKKKPGRKPKVLNPETPSNGDKSVVKGTPEVQSIDCWRSKRVPKINRKYSDFIHYLNTVPSPKPVIEIPAKETPVIEIPVEETPVREIPSKESPVIEIPSEETPVTKTPAEESSVTEIPAEETPATEPEIMVKSSKKKFDLEYYLISSSRCGRPRKYKVGFNFTTLVTKLKEIKLPSPVWKIKVIVKNKLINRIVFTNKEKDERCVKFYRSCNVYDITFGDAKVSLIGAPYNLNTIADLEILLDIINFITKSDPILTFKE